MGPTWNSVACVRIVQGWGVVRPEAQGLVWQSAVSLCTEKELGGEDFRLERDQGSMLPGRFLSRQPPLLLIPQFLPRLQHCPYRWPSLLAKC